jgi:lipoprotein-anchoring transpeptidase ErfK/SrfK
MSAKYHRDVDARRAGGEGLAWSRTLACASVALFMAVACASTCADGARAGAASGRGLGCPAWVTEIGTATATTTAVASPTPTTVAPSATTVGSTSALLSASLAVGPAPVSVTAEYWQNGSLPACAQVQTTEKSDVSVMLKGLLPSTRYQFQLATSSDAGTTLSKTGTFVTLHPGTIAADVMVGATLVGRLDRAAALAVLNHSVGAPLRLTYQGAYWRVLPSRLGAHVDVAHVVAAALVANPAEQLPGLRVSVDRTQLRSYVAALSRRWSHRPFRGSVRLVGNHAVVTPARSGVMVKTTRMVAQLEGELATGERELLPLEVQTTPASTAAEQKVVVVRLSNQTLTAYLNGKPVLKTPVTTGRPALPTPIGSFSVLNRESPYTFHSPWPPGNPYWYPPTPVTWAMEFYNGDFLHDDPGEPTTAFGSDSQNGYFASHGCVHLPHAAMAFLYQWLPVGAPVIVAED